MSPDEYEKLWKQFRTKRGLPMHKWKNLAQWQRARKSWNLSNTTPKGD